MRCAHAGAWGKQVAGVPASWRPLCPPPAGPLCLLACCWEPRQPAPCLLSCIGCGRSAWNGLHSDTVSARGYMGIQLAGRLPAVELPTAAVLRMLKCCCRSLCWPAPCFGWTKGCTISGLNGLHSAAVSALGRMGRTAGGRLPLARAAASTGTAHAMSAPCRIQKSSKLDV